MVYSGAERRRRWGEDQKIELVTRAFAPGAIVAEVARAADLHPSQIYRWRRQLAMSPAGAAGGFAQVVVQSEGSGSGRLPAIRVRLGRADIEIAEHAPAVLAATVLKALSR